MGLPHYREVSRCIFCPDKADSGEHGWSAWAIRQFSGPNDKIFGEFDGRWHFDPNQKQIKIRCVCEACNNVWMKALEDDVIPLVGKMGQGGSVTLDIPQQWTIARWAVAKAMVREHISREKAIYYSDEDRFNLRLGTTIPCGTYVWLAGHVGQETFYARSNDAGHIPGSPYDAQAYFTTFAYERLVIQVVTIRVDGEADAYPLVDCNQRTWGDAMVRIWPTVSKAFWPPLLILDDGLLKSFHRRCASEEHSAHDSYEE
jgi:hypothetical protein